jgi:hypothetical protein
MFGFVPTLRSDLSVKGVVTLTRSQQRLLAETSKPGFTGGARFFDPFLKVFEKKSATNPTTLAARGEL